MSTINSGQKRQTYKGILNKFIEKYELFSNFPFQVYSNVSSASAHTHTRKPFMTVWIIKVPSSCYSLLVLRGFRCFWTLHHSHRCKAPDGSNAGRHSPPLLWCGHAAWARGACSEGSCSKHCCWSTRSAKLSQFLKVIISMWKFNAFRHNHGHPLGTSSKCSSIFSTLKDWFYLCWCDFLEKTRKIHLTSILVTVRDLQAAFWLR